MRNTSRTILVADDDPDTRVIVGSALSAMGHLMIEARDGTQAMEICKDSLIDLAILDVMMPGAYGTDVCKFIKATKTGPITPVLMLTACTSIQDKVTALDGGADDYLTKPFHFQELQARVNALLRVKDLNVSLSEKNAELQSMQEKLLDHERKLVILQMAGTAAHELGQPLSAIILNCHLLEKLPCGDKQARAALESIKQDARRMGELLERLKTADPKCIQEYHGETTILDLARKA